MIFKDDKSRNIPYLAIQTAGGLVHQPSTANHSVNFCSARQHKEPSFAEYSS